MAKEWRIITILRAFDKDQSRWGNFKDSFCSMLDEDVLECIYQSYDVGESTSVTESGINLEALKVAKLCR